MLEVKEEAERTFKRCLGGVLRSVGHSKAMSDTEILRLAEKIIGKEKFIGVYARGEIDVNGKYPPGTCYVLNNESRSTGGEHWLALFYGETGEAILFDSFARRHIIPEFEGKRTEDDKDQEDWQFSCGQRCIAFLCVGALLGDSCYWV